MPVIQLSLARLGAYCKGKVREKTILDTLPYLGLDIEDQSGDVVSVEYSPNRPDFSSEAGIARSLVGLLDISTGPPTFNFSKSKFTISIVGSEISRVRPVIKGLYSEISVTDELIKQLIAMQEDLHDGIGRKRTKVAIGIHNAAVISEQIKYYGVTDENFRFIPLGSSKKQTIREILTSTDQGMAYGKLLSQVFPLLEDTGGNVLSMPPVINGDLTRLEPGISRLFVDITGTDDYAVDAAVAIMAAMLSDVGGRVSQIQVSGPKGDEWAPDMTPRRIPFDLKLSNEILGFDMDETQAKAALEKSRFGLSQGNAIVPRFRSDIIHPIDLAEEVALGYGVGKIQPQVISTSLVGALNPRLKEIDSVVEVLVGLGFTEVWNFSLSPKELVHHCVGDPVRVENSKSQSFEFLRCGLTTSLLQVLGGTSHEEYPQLIFEGAPTFISSEKTVTGILEREHVAALIADSGARYSQIRSKLDAFFRLLIRAGSTVRYLPSKEENELFAKGRTADVFLIFPNKSEEKLGVIGELAPGALEKFGIAVPVVGFELNLEPLLKD
jgi:phenylalanyl-tRNA synthetase beta chain